MHEMMQVCKVLISQLHVTVRQKIKNIFFYLFFDPCLQLVHFSIELLQVFSSTQGPCLICSHLFQSLPLVPELAELFLHQIGCGVQLGDQLFTHLLK